MTPLPCYSLTELNARFYAACERHGITPPIGPSGLPQDGHPHPRREAA